jgi:hypothetical protein
MAGKPPDRTPTEAAIAFARDDLIAAHIDSAQLEVIRAAEKVRAADRARDCR